MVAIATAEAEAVGAPTELETLEEEDNNAFDQVLDHDEGTNKGLKPRSRRRRFSCPHHAAWTAGLVLAQEYQRRGAVGAPHPHLKPTNHAVDVSPDLRRFFLHLRTDDVTMTRESLLESPEVLLARPKCEGACVYAPGLRDLHRWIQDLSRETRDDRQQQPYETTLALLVNTWVDPVTREHSSDRSRPLSAGRLGGASMRSNSARGSRKTEPSPAGGHGHTARGEAPGGGGGGGGGGGPMEDFFLTLSRVAPTVQALRTCAEQAARALMALKDRNEVVKRKGSQMRQMHARSSEPLVDDALVTVIDSALTESWLKLQLFLRHVTEMQEGLKTLEHAAKRAAQESKKVGGWQKHAELAGAQAEIRQLKQQLRSTKAEVKALKAREEAQNAMETRPQKIGMKRPLPKKATTTAADAPDAGKEGFLVEARRKKEAETYESDDEDGALERTGPSPFTLGGHDGSVSPRALSIVRTVSSILSPKDTLTTAKVQLGNVLSENNRLRSRLAEEISQRKEEAEEVDALRATLDEFRVELGKIRPEHRLLMRVPSRPARARSKTSERSAEDAQRLLTCEMELAATSAKCELLSKELMTVSDAKSRAEERAKELYEILAETQGKSNKLSLMLEDEGKMTAFLTQELVTRVAALVRLNRALESRIVILRAKQAEEGQSPGAAEQPKSAQNELRERLEAALLQLQEMQERLEEKENENRDLKEQLEVKMPAFIAPTPKEARLKQALATVAQLEEALRQKTVLTKVLEDDLNRLRQLDDARRRRRDTTATSSDESSSSQRDASRGPVERSDSMEVSSSLLSSLFRSSSVAEHHPPSPPGMVPFSRQSMSMGNWTSTSGRLDESAIMEEDDMSTRTARSGAEGSVVSSRRKTATGGSSSGSRSSSAEEAQSRASIALRRTSSRQTSRASTADLDMSGSRRSISGVWKAGKDKLRLSLSMSERGRTDASGVAKT